MKRFLILSLSLWVLLFAVPLIAVRGQDVPASAVKRNVSSGIDTATEITLLETDGKIIKLPLNKYLEGVLADEMPALFPEEALRAGAVVARTNAMKKAASAASAHKGAMLCSNPAHCAAYKPLSSVAVSWGVSRDAYSEKIRRAVSDTDGEILLYNKAPISATFFDMSSGRTENASDVWGKPIPYLVSVDSTCDAKAEGFSHKISIPSAEFKAKFIAKYPKAKFSPDPATWISNITRSDAGGVLRLTVGGVPTVGSQLRTQFALRSTNFRVACTADTVTFETQGSGHGVGLSQCGARAMADDGRGYRDILTHYFTGVTFGKIQK
ncbi:MAG: stage II sporulation protein D [Oscillospiraceae bacterium]